MALKENFLSWIYELLLLLLVLLLLFFALTGCRNITGNGSRKRMKVREIENEGASKTSARMQSVRKTTVYLKILSRT